MLYILSYSLNSSYGHEKSCKPTLRTFITKISTFLSKTTGKWWTINAKIQIMCGKLNSVWKSLVLCGQVNTLRSNPQYVDKNRSPFCVKVLIQLIFTSPLCSLKLVYFWFVIMWTFSL